MILELSLQELLGEATFHIDAFVKTVLAGDLGEQSCEPGGCEEVGQEGCVGLELVRQPSDQRLLQRDYLVGVEQANHLIIDNILVKGQLHVTLEIVVVVELYLDNL